MSPAGMKFCGNCGALLEDEPARVARDAARDAAQRRPLTAMFCDVVDSTPLVERLDAEDFRDVLRAYRRACATAIERFEGYTAEYVGDGVVAFFGYPRAHEDDAHRAVHAALGILDGLVTLNSDLRVEFDVSLDVRIGLHTGVVVAGEAEDLRAQPDIVGRTPHIAARLESIAQPGTVIISDATRELVDGYFELEALGERELKGVSRPVGIHRVLRPTGAVGRLETAVGRRLTPVVGRADELARLKAAWEQVESGRGAVAHLTGEAGIGKSRLARTLIEDLGEQVGAPQTWQCSAHHRSTALYPVTRWLERTLGLDRTQSAERRRALLEEAVADAGLDADEAVPLLADLLALGGGTGRPRTALDARTALLRVLEALVAGDSERHPLLLLVEDLHWADPTTVELLGRLVRRLPDLPVLCVMTFRPEFEPPWRRRRPALELALGPLTAAEVRALATAASDTALDPATLGWVESAADGVPLFIEEMVKMLVNGDGHADGDGPATTAVPPTLEGLLTERLDRLADLGDVIDVAAILGREFDRSLLGAVAPLGHHELEPALVKLAAQDVLRPVGGAPSRCEFAHALLHDAAYGRILRRRRRDLHGQVADTLVRSFGDVVEREPELVAHHWTCADEPAGAMPYWRAAGARALERAAYLEAAEHFRRGLEALDGAEAEDGDDVARADLLTHLAASVQAGRGYAAAGVDEAYARARTAWERVGDDTRLERVIRGEWMFHLLRGQYDEALALADEMLLLGGREHVAALAEGHMYRGLVEMYLGNFDLAREHLGDAYDRYQPPDSADYVYEAQGDASVGSLAYIALVLWNQGHAAESRERSELSVERADLVGGAVTRAQAWGMRSILHLSRAEPADLARWVQKTYAHSVDHRIGYWRTVSALLQGWMQGRAGDLERGTKRVRESIGEYVASGHRLSLPHFQILLADLHLAGGDAPAALELLRAGEEHIAATGERFSESELFRFKGRALMAGDAPDPDGATAAFERAVASARAQNARLLELRAATRLASHQRRTGAEPTALARVAELCDWFPLSPDVPDVVRAREMLEQQETS